MTSKDGGPALHDRLIARQSTEELERKAAKASRRNIWTKEDVDFAYRRGAEIADALIAEDEAHAEGKDNG